MIKTLGHKFQLIGKRILFVFANYHFRIGRLWKIFWKKEPSYKLKFLKLIFLTGDLVFMPEVYETIMDLFKWKTRSLTEREQKVAQSVYRDLIPWDMVRIDTNALLGPKQCKIAYVSHFTINSYGALQDQILIHELMHIVQYLKYGSAYIPMALIAQRSEEKYNYGGMVSLKNMISGEKDIWALNLEQQADLMRDYFQARQGKQAHWGQADIADLLVYEKFVFDLFKEGEGTVHDHHTNA